MILVPDLVDYEIFYQTFNANNEGGEIKSIKAQSGIAPVVVTESRKEVKLSVNQLSTNAQEPSEGPIANLVNGNTNDFFHTRWSSLRFRCLITFRLISMKNIKFLHWNGGIVCR